MYGRGAAGGRAGGAIIIASQDHGHFSHGWQSCPIALNHAWQSGDILAPLESLFLVYCFLNKGQLAKGACWSRRKAGAGLGRWGWAPWLTSPVGGQGFSLAPHPLPRRLFTCPLGAGSLISALQSPRGHVFGTGLVASGRRGCPVVHDVQDRVCAQCGWGGLRVLSLWAAFSRARRGWALRGQHRVRAGHTGQAGQQEAWRGSPPTPGLPACSPQGSSTWMLRVGQAGEEGRGPESRARGREGMPAVFASFPKH